MDNSKNEYVYKLLYSENKKDIIEEKFCQIKKVKYIMTIKKELVVAF